jgi:hypothetical protein
VPFQHALTPCPTLAAMAMAIPPRFRHLRQRPEVSATHLPGEHLAITVHGTAEMIDVDAPEHAEFRQALLDIYLPR